VRRPYELASSIERIKVCDPEGKRISIGKNFSKENQAKYIQYGALPYRIGKTCSLEFLLITTGQTKQWMIPKGWPVKGLKPTKSAAREAYEEAGIRGAISANQSEHSLMTSAWKRTGSRFRARCGSLP
jgi:ADP-ribose pyrophosphatase YjhB (NUDIX family)